MDPRTIANQYYDAWRHRAGDMSGVPLAPDFVFTGPVASFDNAEAFRAMTRQAGAAVRRFEVRHQFTEGDLVCSVIDWEMAMLPGTLTAAEVLQVRNGTLVRGELIYDAQELREAIDADPVALLDRSLTDTADMFTRVPADAWQTLSPCAGWTARHVGNHLVGSIALLTRVALREPVDPAEFDAHKLAKTDHLGPDPASSLREAAQRCVAAFARPGTLHARYSFPGPDTPGAVIAHICLLESLVHGWDVAHATGAAYRPADAAIAAVQRFALLAVGPEQRAQGLFAAVVPVAPDADRLTATLAHLGRRARPTRPGNGVDVQR
ncbi:MAG TPA: TIGR03086 family metal-binding protein [Kribbellaceae bacterium]